MPGLNRQSEMAIGLTFLGLMVVFLLLAITQFKGDATFLLILAAVIFLGVGLFFLGSRDGTPEGASQQQSVVLSEGRVLTQAQGGGGAGGVLVACRSCSARVPESSSFCGACGARL